MGGDEPTQGVGVIAPHRPRGLIVAWAAVWVVICAVNVAVVVGRRGWGSALLLANVTVLAAFVVPQARRYRRGNDTVELTEQALVVTRRGVELRRYPWGDVLDLSWRGARLGGPVLRVRGRPYDVPGPNEPCQVATVPVASRRARDDAIALLQAAARRQGIPYSPTMAPDINKGRGRPQLPGDSQPRRA